MPSARIAVVGGGIVGLAHAYVAATRGWSVVLFERNDSAQGASIRNFGMIWPIGQPSGYRLNLALRSRCIWQELLEKTGIEIASVGSIHLAHRADERAVIQEFYEIAPERGYQCRWMNAEQIRSRCPAVKAEGLLGGLWSDTEFVIDPRQVARSLPGYLSEAHGVQLRMRSVAHSIDLPFVHTSTETWEVERAVVCSGEDFVTLYPELFTTSGLLRCKLQMMRTAPQPRGWQLGAALTGGLTLRFYPSFQACSTLAALQRRIAAEMPEYDRFGIHVMASQTPAGEVTIGDSHEYGAAISVFDKTEIDQLILAYLDRFLELPSPVISEHWHGIYSKHPDEPYLRSSPAPGVQVVTGLGGAGMTLAFGVAEETWNQWQ